MALEAIGNPKAPAETTTYGDVANMVISLPPDGAARRAAASSTTSRGMPFGTRGGFVVEHNFPADGEYELTIGDMALAREVPRMEFENTVIALLDGKEFYRTTIGGEADHKAIDQKLDPAVEEINGRLRKIRFKATAGQHKLAHHLPAPQLRRKRRAHAHHRARGRPGAHPGRARAADPRAAVGDRHEPVAQPLEDLHLPAARRRARSWPVREPHRREPGAARLPPSGAPPRTSNPLMAFYKAGSATGGFDGGVRDALSAILASPHFLYRAETADAAGGTRTLNDLELASRLSFFLWSSLPDDELLKAAADARLQQARRAGRAGHADAGRPARQVAERRLRLPVAAHRQAGRDHAGPRRSSRTPAACWIRARMLKEELRLFIDSVLRSDRSVIELLTADYTFLNERLAMHYGIETVKGAHFRRVTLTDPARHGLLGKGAILMLTAYPNRTSPVLRGAWILDRLLGTPPADPPLDVPSLPENRRGQPAKTLRARLEQHRANPTCFACHGVMDPLGLRAGELQRRGAVPRQRPATRWP